MDFSHHSDWAHDRATPSAAFQRTSRAGLRVLEDQKCRRKWIVEVLLVAISSMSLMMLLTDATAVALYKLQLLAENDFSKVVVVRHDIDIAGLALAALLPAVLLFVSRKLQVVVEAQQSAFLPRDHARHGKCYEARQAALPSVG